MRSLLVALVLLALAGCGSAPPPEPQQQQQPAPPPKAPDENAALSAITRINDGQKDYHGVNRRYALTFEELMEGHFLRVEPTIANTGYDVKLRPAADAASYVVLGIPSPPSPAIRYFFSDQTGVIRAEQGKDANAQSPPVEAY